MNELKRIIKESTLDVLDEAVHEQQMINRYIASFCWHYRGLHKRIDMNRCVSHE